MILHNAPKLDNQFQIAAGGEPMPITKGPILYNACNLLVNAIKCMLTWQHAE